MGDIYTYVYSVRRTYTEKIPHMEICIILKAKNNVGKLLLS
jgi:hypothetical protein